MDQAQVEAILARFPIFQDLAQQELAEFSRIAQPVSFMPGQFICARGEIGDCMYVVHSGQAQVVVAGPDGERVPVGSIGEGEVFGELSLVDQQPRSADVVAETQVQGFKIGSADFAEMRGRLHPAAYKVQLRIARTLCVRLRDLNTKTFGKVVTRPGAKPADEARSFWQNVTGWIGRS